MTQVDERKVSVYQLAKVVQAEAFYTVADKDPVDRIELVSTRNDYESLHGLIR